jgi:hypothetical protein
MLDLDEQNKIIKEGSPQVVTCKDPSRRRGGGIRTHGLFVPNARRACRA